MKNFTNPQFTTSLNTLPLQNLLFVGTLITSYMVALIHNYLRGTQENKAATTIQSQFRGHSQRTEPNNETVAATRLQSLFRGHNQRTKLNNETVAATRLQSLFRGHNHRAKQENIEAQEATSWKKSYNECRTAQDHVKFIIEM